MPDRIIRAGILTSEKVCSLSFEAEVFYRRLMSVVDDFGRFDGRIAILRTSLYPLQIDKVSDADVIRLRTEVQKVGLIVVYVVDGKDFIEIQNFGQRLRASRSKWPEPAGICQHSPTIDSERMQPQGYAEAYSESESITEADAVTKPKRTRKAALIDMPANFGISDRVRDWAARKGHYHLEKRFEHFVGKAKSKGYQYADWDEGFMTAIRDDWAKLGTGKPESKTLSSRAIMEAQGLL